METVNRPLGGSGVWGQWVQEGSGVRGFGVGDPLGTTAGKGWDVGSGDVQAGQEPPAERRERRVLVGQGSTFPGNWGFTDSRHLLPGAECQPTQRTQSARLPTRVCVRAAGRRLSLQALSLLHAPLSMRGLGGSQ